MNGPEYLLLDNALLFRWEFLKRLIQSIQGSIVRGIVSRTTGGYLIFLVIGP
jgi:hypothetical protein